MNRVSSRGTDRLARSPFEMSRRGERGFIPSRRPEPVGVLFPVQRNLAFVSCLGGRETGLACSMPVVQRLCGLSRISGNLETNCV